MKAAVFRQVGTPMEIEDVVVDEPEGNEVLLRTAATGLCHSDLNCFEGAFEVERPIVLGHEASGIVERVGSAVTDLEVGDHVIVFPPPRLWAMPRVLLRPAHDLHQPPVHSA